MTNFVATKLGKRWDQTKPQKSKHPEAPSGAVSKWEQAIAAQDKLAQVRALKESESRQQRLAYLFDSDSENETRLDHLAAQESVDKFLVKVDHHLGVEKALIKKWN